MKQSESQKLKTLLKDHNLKIKKKFGQNFLIDQNILYNIIEHSDIDEETCVVEIGPGLGSLTEHLIPRAKNVLAYEIDNDLIPILKKAFKSPNFHLIHDDVLKRNIDEDINNIDPNTKKVVVIANLPYYITTPILMKCLEETKQIKKMVIMMQYEVAKRITASKNTKDYNALSLAVQFRAKTTFAFKVPRTVFIPSPNVDSAVITLDFHDKYASQVLSEPYFFRFLKAAFKQRRKTLLNNLHVFLEKEKAIIIEQLNELQINPQARAESLSLDQFIVLSNYYVKETGIINR